MVGEDESGNSSESVARALVGYVREDMRSMEGRLSDQLSKLVTNDAFARERERVDQRMADLGSDLQEEKAARIAADAALQAAADSAAKAAKDAQDQRVRTRAAWKQAIVVGVILAAVGGFVTVLVAIVQSAANLN